MWLSSHQDEVREINEDRVRQKGTWDMWYQHITEMLDSVRILKSCMKYS
jgi:hypothetical protein